MEPASIGLGAGILSRPEIVDYLTRPWPERVVVTPLVDPETQIGSNSIDLRLGGEFIIPRVGRIGHLDFVEGGQGFQTAVAASHEHTRIGIGDRYVLHPQRLVLAGVLEHVRIPQTLAGLVMGRSSWERQGVVIPTSRISPGFRGCITLQLISHASVPIVLRPGVRICQLLLLPMSSPVQDFSRYEGAVYPETTKIHRDEEIRALMQGRFRLIVGIVGTLVSGKSEIAEYLVRKHGFLHLSLATMVHEECRRRGLRSTPDNLQNVGNSLRQTHDGKVLVDRLRPRMETLPGDSYLVVDGIKNPAEVDELRRWPNFVLIAVNADQETRLQRARQRSRPDFPDAETRFLELDSRDKGEGEPEWGQQVNACIEKADFVIENSGSLEDLYLQLEDILTEVKGLT